MDPVKAQKLRAMNLYKKSDPFLQSLLLHSLIALACSLFCSYSCSFPNSFYTIKHLLFHSLPSTWSWFVNPRCLFVVVNFIVMFLIGESRLSGKQSSTPPTEIYDDYVARARSLRRRPSNTCQEIKKEQVILDPTEDITGIETEDHNDIDEVLLKEENAGHDEDFEECEEYRMENEKDEPEEDDEEEEQKEEEEEEEDVVQEQIEVEEEEEVAVGIPAEELNKRVEDFIARVNRQRWLEARFMVCST